MKRMSSISKRFYLFFVATYVILIGIQTMFFHVLEKRVEQESIKTTNLLEGEVTDLEQSVCLFVNQFEEILLHNNSMSSLYESDCSSDSSIAKVAIDEIIQPYIESNRAIVDIKIIYDNSYQNEPEAKSFSVKLSQMPDAEDGRNCLVITKGLYGQKKGRPTPVQIGDIIFFIDPSAYFNPVILDSYSIILSDKMQPTNFHTNTKKQNELFSRELFKHQIKLTVYEKKSQLFQLPMRYLWLFHAIIIFIFMYIYSILMKKHRTDSTNKMINEEIETNKSMTLYALQSQINPHFLYNTLQCIRGIALRNGIDEIGDICTSLSQIFRYSIKGKSLTCLGEELKIAQKYIEVMNIRYEGRFLFHFTIDPQLYDAKVFKMIFQPILENTFLHNNENENTMDVDIYSECNDNMITIYFKEFSPHTSEEKINKVNHLIHQQAECNYEFTNEIGLINIYQRLVAVFGDKADLKIYKQDNFLYTCLLFPYMSMDDQTN